MDPTERRPRPTGSRIPGATPTPFPSPCTHTRAPSLRRDPDDPAVWQALAALARGCDLVFPSRFRKRLRDFRQVWGQGGVPAVSGPE